MSSSPRFATAPLPSQLPLAESATVSSLPQPIPRRSQSEARAEAEEVEGTLSSPLSPTRYSSAEARDASLPSTSPQPLTSHFSSSDSSPTSTPPLPSPSQTLVEAQKAKRASPGCIPSAKKQKVSHPLLEKPTHPAEVEEPHISGLEKRLLTSFARIINDEGVGFDAFSTAVQKALQHCQSIQREHAGFQEFEPNKTPYQETGVTDTGISCCAVTDLRAITATSSQPSALPAEALSPSPGCQNPRPQPQDTDSPIRGLVPPQHTHDKVDQTDVISDDPPLSSTSYIVDKEQVLWALGNHASDDQDFTLVILETALDSRGQMRCFITFKISEPAADGLARQPGDPPESSSGVIRLVTAIPITRHGVRSAVEQGSNFFLNIPVPPKLPFITTWVIFDVGMHLRKHYVSS